jgi:hypothetical protein
LSFSNPWINIERYCTYMIHVLRISFHIQWKIMKTNKIAFFLVGSVLLIVLVVCVVLLCVLALGVPCCDVRYDFCIQTMLGSSSPPVICRKAHVLFTSFVLLRIVVSNTYCSVFLICFSVLSFFYYPFGILCRLFISIRYILWITILVSMVFR